MSTDRTQTGEWDEAPKRVVAPRDSIHPYVDGNDAGEPTSANASANLYVPGRWTWGSGSNIEPF
jgi:hypothetical protein